MKSNDTPHTLSKSDISSERNVSRRAVLGMIGIGTGVGAAALLLPTRRGEAQFKGYAGAVRVGSGDVNDAPKKPAFKAQSPGKNAAKSSPTGRITGVAQDPADPAVARTAKRLRR